MRLTCSGIGFHYIYSQIKLFLPNWNLQWEFIVAVLYLNLVFHAIGKINVWSEVISVGLIMLFEIKIIINHYATKKNKMKFEWPVREHSSRQ